MAAPRTSPIRSWRIWCGLALLVSLASLAPATAAGPAQRRLPREPAQPAERLALPDAQQLGALLRSRLQSRPARAPRGAQARELRALGARAQGRIELRMRPETGTPRQLKGRKLEPAAGGTRETARRFLRENRELLRLRDPDNELLLRSERRDRQGRSHLRFAQRYAGLEVWPAGLTVHLDPGGNVHLMDGAFVPTPSSVPKHPSRSEADALAAARSAAPLAATAHGEAQLIVYAPGNVEPRLAWRVELLDGLGHWRVLVDATTGETLAAYDRVMHSAESGSGVDLFSTTRALTVWRDGSVRSLVDTSKPMYDPSSAPPDLPNTRGAILVLDAQNQPPSASPTSLPAIAQVTSNDPDDWPLPASVSAAWSLSETYDFFEACHGHDSFDDDGSNVVGVIRLGSGFQNAFWSPGLELMALGDGGPFAGALDVVAHEFTHGVIAATADLAYLNQSGAANEAFADIFGELVESGWDGVCAPTGAPDWQVGSALPSPVRSLSAPGSLTIGTSGVPYPSRMGQFIQADDPLLDTLPGRDNGGVHLNSTILGHAFYLLAAGGASPIGLAKARDVFFRALDLHLVSNSQFVDVRLACIQAAEDLYGLASPEALAVAAVFDAVEIFDGPATPLPPGVGGVAAADSTVFVRQDSGSGSFFLQRFEAALGDPAGGADLSQFSVGLARPSVTGNGEKVWFIDSIQGLCSVDTDADAGNPAEQEQCVEPLGDPPPIPPVASLAVSPDGGLLAVVFLATPANALNIVDLQCSEPLDPCEDATHLLDAPTQDGQALANLLFADVMSFTLDGSRIVFDALNELPLAEAGSLFVWSIYSLDLASGNVQSVVPPDPGFDFDYPSLSHTNDGFLTYDAIDQVSGAVDVFAANLVTGQTVQVAGPLLDVSVPFYTGDDSSIVYTLLDGTPSVTLMEQPLLGDRLTPDGPPVVWQPDGDFAAVYRRGSFSAPDPDRDLDGVSDASDNCPDEPNSGQADTGGVGLGSPPDGIGDACQCGDVLPDGTVTGADADDLAAHLSGNTPPGFALQACSTIGNLECNLVDLAVMRRAIAAAGPGIAPVCATAQP